MPTPLFNRPFALSIGPQRSATSWLDRYLRFRGDVCLPYAVKETYFFNRHYNNGADFYAAHFRLAPTHRMVLEVTAQSFDHWAAPRRVRDLLGDDLTFLCPLRHPVIRSYSLYLHYLRYGIVRGCLREAAAAVPQIITSSRYATHLGRWYDCFDPARILIVHQEELDIAPGQFIARICAHLKLPVISPDAAIAARCNETASAPSWHLARWSQISAEWLRYRRLYSIINMAKALGLKKLVFGHESAFSILDVMSREDYDWLDDQLRPEMEKFELLTGRPNPHWRNLIPDVQKRFA